MRASQMGIRIGLTLVVIGSIASLGYSEARREDTPGQAPLYDLSGRMKAGDYTSSQDALIQQSIRAGTYTSTPSTKMLMEYDLSVTHPEDKPDTHVLNRITRAKMSLQGLPGNIEISADTAHPDQTNANSGQLLTNLQSMLDLEIQETLDPDGLCQEATPNKTVPGITDDMQGKMPVALTFLQILPDTPVGKGAIWHRNALYAPPGGEETYYEVECELLDVRQTEKGPIAVIQWKGTIKLDQLAIASGVAKNVKLDATGNMEIAIDTLIPESMSLKLNGSMNITTDEVPVSITLTMDSHSTFTPIDKPANQAAESTTPPAAP